MKKSNADVMVNLYQDKHMQIYKVPIKETCTNTHSKCINHCMSRKEKTVQHSSLNNTVNRIEEWNI